MSVYAVGIEFIGTHYKGWQRQAHDPNTVQACLEQAFSKVANQPIELFAAGRTDAGVHASNMIAHFQSDVPRKPYNWIRGVNSLLPSDIAIRWLTPMPDDFHARFLAVSRRYRYVTLNQPHRPAILAGQVTHHYAPLELAPMQLAVKDLLGTHDFSSFRASGCQSNRPIRHMMRADLIQHGQFIVLDIEADGFLHHMVRNIMGTLFAIGEGQLPPNAIKTLIAQKDRRLAPPTAPADGLYFINAYYLDKFQKQLPNLPLTPSWLNLP